MRKTTNINVAQDFSKYPAGRFYNDGPYPGAKFRDELLSPALRESDEVTVTLSGVMGYGSSFLEEAFGGLVRLKGFSAATLRKKLRLEGDKTDTDEIWSHIKNAKTGS